MRHILFNTKNEKVFIVSSIAKNELNSLLEVPNFYAIFFFKDSGSIIIDDSIKSIQKNYILFYYPYQKLHFKESIEGYFIQFHPDFFCIDIHAKDIGCQGLLFNNFLNDTILRCSDDEFNTLNNSLISLQTELFTKNIIGQLDMVSSLLKILLINAVRIKRKQQDKSIPIKENRHLQLEQLIEQNYSKEASPEFYANQLSVSISTLNRLSNKYFKKKLISLLNQKKIAKAKNQLFLTNHSIKEIAYFIGFNDPLYFTRVFKKHTGISPTEFRKQVKDNRLL